MGPIQKRIITDEAGRPVAVQVDYQQWLEIERALESPGRLGQETLNLSRFSGRLRFEEDPLAYQRRMGQEWT